MHQKPSLTSHFVDAVLALSDAVAALLHFVANAVVAGKDADRFVAVV